jgi:hypothetical protein
MDSFINRSAESNRCQLIRGLRKASGTPRRGASAFGAGWVTAFDIRASCDPREWGLLSGPDMSVFVLHMHFHLSDKPCAFNRRIPLTRRRCFR